MIRRVQTRIINHFKKTSSNVSCTSRKCIMKASMKWLVNSMSFKSFHANSQQNVWNYQSGFYSFRSRHASQAHKNKKLIFRRPRAKLSKSTKIFNFAMNRLSSTNIWSSSYTRTRLKGIENLITVVSYQLWDHSNISKQEPCRTY